MKRIYKSKKCKECGKILNNCVAIRTTYKKSKKQYFCNSKCFGPNYIYFLMDDLIEFVEIRDIKK